MQDQKEKQYIRNRHAEFLLCWGLAILFSWLLQAALTPPLFAQRAPGPNEVAVYEHINYVGNQEIYALEPGMRQKFVPYLPNTVDDMISSIQVGADVGVMFTTAYNFREQGDVALQSSNDLSSSKPEFNDKISSLIVFPKSWSAPIGVLIIGKSTYENAKISRFFPAPEKMTERIAYYPNIGYDLNDNAEVVYIWPNDLNSPLYNQVSVKLCEDYIYGGKSITLPGPGSQTRVFQLYDYQFSDKTSSLQVIHNYPVSVKRPTPLVKQNAPLHQQIQAIIPADTSDVRGQWKSNIGLVFNITQQGYNFQWTVVNSNETGSGTVNLWDVTASWQGGLRGSGSAKGQITDAYRPGLKEGPLLAAAIEWEYYVGSEKVKFYRD